MSFLVFKFQFFLAVPRLVVSLVGIDDAGDQFVSDYVFLVEAHNGNALNATQQFQRLLKATFLLMGQVYLLSLIHI